MITKPANPKKLLTFPNIKEINIEEFKKDITSSDLLEKSTASNLSVFKVSENYEETLFCILEKLYLGIAKTLARLRTRFYPLWHDIFHWIMDSIENLSLVNKRILQFRDENELF